MLKFIPQFSCWKIGPDHVLVIASCAKTHEVRLYVVSRSSYIESLTPDSPMPDVRALVPCRWHALTSVQRASVRDTFHQALCEIYGEELYADLVAFRESDACG